MSGSFWSVSSWSRKDLGAQKLLSDMSSMWENHQPAQGHTFFFRGVVPVLTSPISYNKPLPLFTSNLTCMWCVSMPGTSGSVSKCQWNRRGRRTRGGRGQEMIPRVLALLSSSVSAATLAANASARMRTTVVIQPALTAAWVALRTVVIKKSTTHQTRIWLLSWIPPLSPWKPPGQQSSHTSRQLRKKRRGDSEICSLSCVATAAWLSEKHVRDMTLTFFFILTATAVSFQVLV